MRTETRRPGEAEVDSRAQSLERRQGAGWEGEVLCFRGKRAETAKRC